MIRDFVYVKLHPYRHIPVAYRRNCKLSHRYFGPYKVTKCIGTVAYKQGLPAHNKIHNHVSQLKKHVHNMVATTNLPQQQKNVMNARSKGMPMTKVLVKWKHHLP